ncbi:MAG: TatD family hydrolase [Bacteroidales bacterium]|nr:TatD family hydrolase [Bacteroidales bacterium]
MWIDTHTHIFSQQFDNDIDEAVSRAKEAGLDMLLLPNIDIDSIEPMNNLCEKYPDYCFPMMGIHPTSVEKDFSKQLLVIESELAKGKYCAVGEIGIDLYWDKTLVEEQKLVFASQIDMALKYNLPIVIHARDSFDEIFEVLDNYKDRNLKGVFHSFTGSAEQALKAISMGFYIGINGIVTFKNSGLDKIIPQIDINSIILETDAPYLAPVPYRGKRNESSYLPLIGSKISDILEINEKKVAEITSNNARKLFNL